jgi:hypothetical protein
VSEVVQSSSAATEVEPDNSSAMGKTSVFGGSERAAQRLPSPTPPPSSHRSDASVEHPAESCRADP